MKKLTCFLAALLIVGAILFAPTAAQAGRIAMTNHSAEYCYMFRVKVEFWVLGESFGTKTYKFCLKANSGYVWDDVVGSVEEVWVTRVAKDKCCDYSQAGTWHRLWTFINTCGKNPSRTFRFTADEQGLVELTVIKEGC